MHAGSAVSTSFGKGLHPDYITGIYCTGDELDIFSCALSTSQCFDSYDAGVICERKQWHCSYSNAILIAFCIAYCYHGSVRLTDANGRNVYGRVEICLSGIWTTICSSSHWDIHDASVICNQLGFSPYGLDY